MPSVGPRKMHWCFTDWPNEEETYTPTFIDKDMNYLIYGNETCPDTGKKHFQGYVQFKKAYALSSVKKYFSDKVHAEPAKGTPDQASTYCKKEGDFKEFGTMQCPGKRNDLMRVKELLDSGTAVPAVIKECFTVASRNYKFIEYYHQQCLPDDRTCFTKDYCTILWGDPGSGKSRTAYNCDSYQVLQYDPKSRFFSASWDGSKRVIIDDVCPATFVPRELWLNILDPYSRQLKINVKGSNSKFAPTELVLTSNFDPATWMAGDAAFQRRLDEFCTIKHMVGFVDVAMRRFFEPPAVGTGTNQGLGTNTTDTEPAYISDSDSEHGSAVDWASAHDDDSDIEYIERVQHAAIERANAGASEYVGPVERPGKRCKYAEEAAEDDIGSSTEEAMLEAADLY